MPSRTPLPVRLTSERNMRINDRFTARDRMRRILHGDIAPMLQTAHDALKQEPPLRQRGPRAHQPRAGPDRRRVRQARPRGRRRPRAAITDPNRRHKDRVDQAAVQIP